MTIFSSGEPRRMAPGNKIEILEENQRESYKLWKNKQVETHKNDIEDIPMALLSHQLNQEPPYEWEEPEIIFALKNINGNFIAGGTTQKCTSKNGEIVAELSGVYVTPTERRKGVATQIDEERIKWCEGKFDSLKTHISANNIPSLRLKFKQGFVLENLAVGLNDKKEEVGSCLLTKKISGNTDDQSKCETITVSFADLEKLSQLTQAGWVGIKLDPITDEKNHHLANWLLTLRKKV